jgi:hypothetical protein
MPLTTSPRLNQIAPAKSDRVDLIQGTRRLRPDNPGRPSSLTVEQALQDSDTADAVAALTAVQTQEFSRASTSKGYSSGSTAGQRMLPDVDGNQYAWSRFGTRDVSGSNGSGIDLLQYKSQYQPMLPRMEPSPSFTEPYQGISNPHDNHLASTEIEHEGVVRNKKRRITSSPLQSFSAIDPPPFFRSPHPSSSHTTTPPLQTVPYKPHSSSTSHALNSAEGNRNGSYEAEDTDQSDHSDPKRRKVQRACDLCRRKKIRCDGAHSSRRNQKCSNCVESKTECKYVEAAKRRGPPLGYIETLEWKVAKLEALAQKVSSSLII